MIFTKPNILSDCLFILFGFVNKKTNFDKISCQYRKCFFCLKKRRNILFSYYKNKHCNLINLLLKNCITIY